MKELDPTIQLAINEAVAEAVKNERDESDKAYALKWVERGAFAILGVFGIAIANKVIELIGLK